MKVYYSEAFKSGKSYCKKCQTKGIDSELVVLDDLLDNNLSNQGVDIGQKYIPLEFVVGTKTRGRKKVFAGNFMPIQDEESEFAYKWECLCSSHLEEGIREPIKVYEYMNRYYVEEGNKRVSVLKFFKGYEILAQVKRIYPANKQDPKVQMYYDFLEFNRYSGLEDIEFTKKGAYLEFQTLLGKDKKEKWSEEETKSIHADYVLFRKAFEDKNGHKLHCSVGDAFLTYMKIFGIDRLHKQTKKEITACLSKIWEEIKLLQEDSLIEVKLKPEGKGRKILNSINLSKKNIAFVYSGPIEESGWRKNHEKGRLFVQSALSTKIDTKAYIVSKQENGEDVLRKAIEEGAKIIFAPEVNLYKACIKVAAEHPHVKILNCSLNMPHKLVKSYYPRIYEAKFITGAIAGVLCENNKIGYICKYPIYGAIAEINAFARGVALVNPKAKVYLEWSSKIGTLEAEKKLQEKDIHIISYREFDYEEEEKEKRFGLAFFEEGKSYPIALPMWDFSTYYKKMIERILDGSFDYESEKSNKSLNYYWGISAGVIDIIYSDRIPESVLYLGKMIFQSIKNGTASPFYNLEKKKAGSFNLDQENNEENIHFIFNMDYLEDNVVGTIPKYTDLGEQVQEVVKNIGVKSSRKESIE